MTDVLPGQLDMLDLLEGSTLPSRRRASFPLSSPRIICPHCRSNWGHGLKPEVLARLAEEHAPAGDDRCFEMVARGVTEPYYAPGETPWVSGIHIQYPRPKGYGGLYQLRSPG